MQSDLLKYGHVVARRRTNAPGPDDTPGGVAMAKRTCSFPSCGDSAIALSWCPKHYQRWKKHGDPAISLLMREATDDERFWAKVNKEGPVPTYRPELGPCWLWTRATDKAGYGIARWGGRSGAKAHQVAYVLLVDPVPPGLQPDHLCKVRHCVKSIANEQGPAHLEAVTPRINTLRGDTFQARNAAKTYCQHGHPFSAENTRLTPKGERVCLTCRRKRDREAKARGRLRLKEPHGHSAAG